MGSTRTNGACGDNAKDGSKNERNKEEESDEWDEEDGEEEEKEEKDRKEDVPTEDEENEVTVVTKNLFQPSSNKLSNCRAQPVAETFQGDDNSSGKETAILGCF